MCDHLNGQKFRDFFFFFISLEGTKKRHDDDDTLRLNIAYFAMTLHEHLLH